MMSKCVSTPQIESRLELKKKQLYKIIKIKTLKLYQLLNVISALKFPLLQHRVKNWSLEGSLSSKIN